MREIKFRALSRDIKEGKHFWLYCTIGQEWYFPIKEETIGQFIGLKDKNNKEIYGEDFVKDNYGKINKVIMPFPWIFLDGDCVYTPDELAERVEIIGNIYENPELLKAEL